MLWWSLVLSLFGIWILSLAAGYTLGGAVHGFLLGGLAIAALRVWQEGHALAALSPRRRRRRSASSAGRHRAAQP